MRQLLFWTGVAGVAYSYFGYPLVLWLIVRLRHLAAPPVAPGELPAVSMIIPVHNEASRLLQKVRNTEALRYPADRLEVLFVSDGSTDSTVDVLRATASPSTRVIVLTDRGGKARALNAGLEHASHDIVVFTDAAIALEPGALAELVQPFADPAIGCVSGEDVIPESGGEALYGRYELFIRRLESAVHSIAGASGSFYAQRRSLCRPFVEGLAPDFLSVLRTVEQGARAVSEPKAVGFMASTKDPGREFDRKVRTLLRGMTALFAYGHLMNPFRYGLFAFILFSHKLMRWSVPLFMALSLVSALALWNIPVYRVLFAAQLGFYLAALAAFRQWAGVHQSLVGRIALYFTSVNLAVLAAWTRYARGVRQELWTPTQR